MRLQIEQQYDLVANEIRYVTVPNPANSIEELIEDTSYDTTPNFSGHEDLVLFDWIRDAETFSQIGSGTSFTYAIGIKRSANQIDIGDEQIFYIEGDDRQVIPFRVEGVDKKGNVFDYGVNWKGSEYAWGDHYNLKTNFIYDRTDYTHESAVWDGIPASGVWAKIAGTPSFGFFHDPTSFIEVFGDGDEETGVSELEDIYDLWREGHQEEAKLRALQAFGISADSLEDISSGNTAYEVADNYLAPKYARYFELGWKEGLPMEWYEEQPEYLSGEYKRISLEVAELMYEELERGLGALQNALAPYEEIESVETEDIARVLYMDHDFDVINILEQADAWGHRTLVMDPDAVVFLGIARIDSTSL
jgi:hypothetical protein